MKNEKYKIILLVLLIAFIGGATGVFSKIALREVSPTLFLLLRFIFALIIFTPFFIKEPDSQLENKKRLIFISLFATLNVTLFIFGLRLTTAVISQILYAAVPLFAGVFSYFITREGMGLKKISGIIVGFMGTLLIVSGPMINSTSVWNGNIFGNGIILAGVVSFALYTVLSKKYEDKYSPLVLVKYFVLTTISVQTILVLLTDARHELVSLSDISPYTWFLISFVGVVGTTLYYLPYQYVIKRATPVLASTVLYLQPLFAILWAYILLGEKITSIFVLGGAMIFLGVALVFGQYRPKVA